MSRWTDNHAAFHHNETGRIGPERDPPLKVLLFTFGWVTEEVKRGPVVIRWAQGNSQSSAGRILIYSLVKKLQNWNQLKQSCITDFLYKLQTQGQGQTLFSEQSCWYSRKSLIGAIWLRNKWGIDDRKCAKCSSAKPSLAVYFQIYCPHSGQNVHCEWFNSLTGEFCQKHLRRTSTAQGSPCILSPEATSGRADTNSKSVQRQTRCGPEGPVSFPLSSSRPRQKRS